MKAVSRAVRDFCRKADMLLLCLCLLSTAYGMVLISSAAHSQTGGAAQYLIRQAMACGIGVVLFIVFTLIDLRVYAALWKWIAGFNVGFVALLIWFGEGKKGNTSWLRFDFLPFDIQPAEVVKVSFVILMAYQMYLLREKINRVWAMGTLFAHLGAMVGLIIYASNDMGVAFIYVFAFVCMMIVGGVNAVWFLSGALAIGAATPVVWHFLSPNRKQRILFFLSPESDPLKSGWQVLQSKLAFVNGNLTGAGLYKGSQTQLGRIPEQHTDSIFTVAGEELGFIGSMAIVILLTLVIGRCIYTAIKAPTLYGSLICAGIAGILIFQVFENLCMCMGLTPIIGVTLPFFSYGGTSLISMFAAMGIISSVKYHPFPSWLKDRAL